MNGNHLWNWDQIYDNYNLLFINIFRNITNVSTPTPPFFILCQKWRLFKPQNLIKFQFLITPCSHICRIASIPNAQSTSTFSRISDSLFSNNTFYFLLINLTHHKATLKSDQQTTFVMLTSIGNWLDLTCQQQARH